MPRYGLKITLISILLIVAIMLVAYKVYQPPPSAEAPPPPAPRIEAPSPAVQEQGQASQEPTVEPDGVGSNITINASQAGEANLQHRRGIARIVATISQPPGQQALQQEDTVTTRPTLNIDLGFLRSVKPILLETHISGRVTSVELVNINGYCIKCGLLITVEDEGGVRYVLALGQWAANDRIVSTVNLLLYIQPGDTVRVEAVGNGYEYKGNPLYIAYEIKVLNKGIELERNTSHEHEGDHYRWEN